MPFSTDGLIVDDFWESGWREIVAETPERDCCNYSSRFQAKATEARNTGDEQSANIFAFLSDITSMFIDENDSADPLKPMLHLKEGRTAIPSDFDPTLNYLAGILPHIDDPELKARVADVLWLRKRDFRAAREAVVSYLAAARLTDHESWPPATDRIQRALNIAVQVKQKDLIEDAVRRVEEGLATFNGDEASFLPARLMKILLERKAGEAINYSVMAEKFAVAAEGRGDWYAARTYWDLRASWDKLTKDDTKAEEACRRSAETYVNEAESRIASGETQGYMVAAHFIERAIQAFRSIGGKKERIDELHHRLLTHQEKAVAEMKSVSVEFDPSAIIAEATKAVSDKSLYDAIFAFAQMNRSPQKSRLREQAERQRQEFVFSHLATTRSMNSVGRTVARRDPPDAGESEDEADLRIEMYKVATVSQAITAQAMILPAREQILREHTVRDDHLMVLVHDNPFVPAGRAEFFARGLQAGFRNDFVVAVHLLTPQIENSVRYLLEEQGIITSGLDGRGIQDERDLNRTLREPEFAEPLKKVLGEDLLFDLRGLLIERHGSNLRNNMAHGLLDYTEFYSAPCIYLWWLTLRLCCLPLIAARFVSQQDEADKSTLTEVEEDNVISKEIASD